MKIEHIAIWSRDVERLKTFYVRYFGGIAGEKYFNPRKDFQSYFLTFEEGCRLELMQMTGIGESSSHPHAQDIGLAHFAVSVGSKSAVDLLTERLRKDGLQGNNLPKVLISNVSNTSESS